MVYCRLTPGINPLTAELAIILYAFGEIDFLTE